MIPNKLIVRPEWSERDRSSDRFARRMLSAATRWLAVVAAAVAIPLSLGEGRSALAQPSEGYRLIATWPVSNGPERVVVAPAGDVYVTAAGGTRVERRSPAGVVLASSSVVGVSELAVDDDGSLYAVSGVRDKIDKYGANGVLQWSYPLPAFGPIGTPSGVRPPHGAAIAWNPVLERITIPSDFGDLFTGLGFRLRQYTKGGVYSAGFTVLGPYDTYGDASALSDTINLLNRTHSRIERYQNGNPVGQISLAEPSERIAAGADGAQYAIARARWVYKYAAGGQLMAVWDALDVNPDPSSGSLASDLDVDAAGNVYVADAARNQVRVYALDPDPTASPNPPPDPADFGCQVFPDKFADPTRLRLGERTKVTLRLDGGCPEVSERADIMLVIDTSGSMTDDGKLQAAKDAIQTFMVLKDLHSPPGRDRVGLAAFDIDSRLVVPLTEDSTAVINAAQGLTAYGGTDIGAGIDEAVRELTGPRRRVDAQPIIILMTDGTPTSVTGAASLAAADRARYLTSPPGCYAQSTCASRLYAIGLGGDVDQNFLRIVATTPDQYYFAPDPSDLEDVYSTIAKRIYATELLKSVRIVDLIPDNMTYIADSAVPTASYDGVAHSLTWDLDIVPFSGTELSYWLLPEEVGRWPTNIVATYDGPDGLGEVQIGEFPIPIVIVEDDTPTPTAVTPSATPSPSSTPPPTLTPTPTSSPPTPPLPTVTVPTPTSTPSPTPTATTSVPTLTQTVPTATTTTSATPSPTITPSATPGRYTIYVVIVYNSVCFKRYTDVALVIDASTTMLRKDAGGQATKLEAARDAARAFLDQLTLEPDRQGRHDQASIVWFNETSAIAQPLTADRAALDRALDGITPVEGSRIDLGVSRGHEAAADPDLHVISNTPVVVLLSDGIPNHTTFDAMFRAADSAKRDGTVIYTAGHGLDVEEWALRRVASQPDDYFYAPTTNEMKTIYEQIAGEVVCR